MFDKKVIFHALNGSLPYWSYLYPAIPEWIENAKDWINKKPWGKYSANFGLRMILELCRNKFAIIQ